VPLSTVDEYQSMDEIEALPGDFQPVQLVNTGVNNWNLEEAIKLRVNEDYSFGDIADHFQMPRSTIYKRMKKFTVLMTGRELVAFRKNKTDMLDSSEATLLSLIGDNDKQKAASLNNVAFTLRQVHDMNRIHKGLSSENVLVRVLDVEDQAFLDDHAGSYASKLISDAEESESVTDD